MKIQSLDLMETRYSENVWRKERNLWKPDFLFFFFQFSCILICVCGTWFYTCSQEHHNLRSHRYVLFFLICPCCFGSFSKYLALEKCSMSLSTNIYTNTHTHIYINVYSMCASMYTGKYVWALPLHIVKCYNSNNDLPWEGETGTGRKDYDKFKECIFKLFIINTR